MDSPGYPFLKMIRTWKGDPWGCGVSQVPFRPESDMGDAKEIRASGLIRPARPIAFDALGLIFPTLRPLYDYGWLSDMCCVITYLLLIRPRCDEEL
jgi:hypothetical protein